VYLLGNRIFSVYAYWTLVIPMMSFWLVIVEFINIYILLLCKALTYGHKVLVLGVQMVRRVFSQVTVSRN